MESTDLQVVDGLRHGGLSPTLLKLTECSFADDLIICADNEEKLEQNMENKWTKRIKRKADKTRRKY